MTFLPSIMFMRCLNKFNISLIRYSYLRLVSIHINSANISGDVHNHGNRISRTAKLWSCHWRRFSVHQAAQQRVQGSQNNFSCNGTAKEDSGLVVGDVIDQYVKHLVELAIPEPMESVELFVAHVMGRSTLHGVSHDKCLTQSEVERVQKMVKMRLHRVPVQYILGEWDFCDLTLKMRPPVFIPRPETEELVEFIKSYLHETELPHSRMLEVGCGTGAITLAVLKEFPHLKAVVIDKTREACDLTWENARRLGLTERLDVLHRDITEDVCVLGRFDLLVSNPPYISTGDIDSLDPQVTSYEDRTALDGGADGLDVVKLLLEKSSSLLNHNGTVWLEVDMTHPSIVQDMLEQGHHTGLHYVRTLQDFTSRPRFCVIKLDKDNVLTSVPAGNCSVPPDTPKI